MNKLVIGHHNAPAGTRHRLLTCLTSGNTGHCLPPEICGDIGKKEARKKEREMGSMVAKLHEVSHSSAIEGISAKIAPSDCRPLATA